MLSAQDKYTALNGPYIGTPTKIISAGGNLLGMVSGNGIMKSTDGGLNWTASNTGLTNRNLVDFTKDASTGKLYALTYNQVFTSVDNGATWTLTANTGFQQARFIRKTTGYVFIVGYNSLIYRSSNDGVSWAQLNSFSGDPRDFEVNSTGYFYIATSGNGIFRSTNNGLDVDQLGAGEGLTDPNIYSLAINGTSIFATSGTAPFKSTNNGDSWVSVKNNITDVYFDWATNIEKDPSGNIYLFNGSKVWKTVNGGTSWTSFASPPTSGGQLTMPYFESASTFYVGVENKLLYKTVDSGVSWTPLTENGIITASGSDMIISDNGRLFYTTGFPNGFYMSIDDGASWDFLGSGTLNRQVYGFYKSGTTLYGYGLGIIKTTTPFSSWTEQNAGSYYFQNLASNDGVNMYSFSSYYDGPDLKWRVLKSNDSGANWTGLPLTGAMPSPTCSYFQDQNDFIVGNGGNLFIRIYESCSTNKNAIYKIDPGTGATTLVGSLPAVNNIEDIEFFNGKLYVFTNNGKLNISSDGGLTWSTKTTSTSNGRLKVINDNTFFILNSSVFISTDAGDSWVNTGSPGSTNKYNQFALLSSANYAYISQYQNVMFKSKTPIIPPAAPSSLSSFYSDRNSVGLIFTDNSSNEDYFVVEMAVGASTQFDSVATTTRSASYARNQAVTYVVRDAQKVTLLSNTTYKFRVRASAAGGKSAPSNEISATTTQDCSATSDIPLNRSWTAATLGQSGPIMTKSNQTVTGSNGFYEIEDIALGASTGLSPQPYEPGYASFDENCGVVSMNNLGDFLPKGNGTWNATTKKITIPWFTHPAYPYREETTVFTLNATDPIPAAPTGLTAAVYLPGAILLNWQSGNFTTAFEVERSLNSGSDFAKIADVTFPKIAYKDIDPTLVSGTTYYYRVKAKNTTGSSAYTAVTNAIPRSNYLFLPMDNLPALTYSQTGGGGAWGDVDGDGINDLFLPILRDSLGNEVPPVIFKGKGMGQFTKLVVPELANEAAATRSVKIIDVNNDGLNDLFLTRPYSNDLLLTKNADGSYTKTLFTEYIQGGVPGGSWVDYDNDGYLDLFAYTSLGAGVASDKYLFHNNGNGTFTRITEGELVTDFGATRDAEWADYDNDGDQDVIVLNVGILPGIQSNSRLYQNNGNGTFTRVLGSVFETILSQDRTASWGDYDNDGDLDVFIGSQTQSVNPQYINRLFKNNGDGTFSEAVGSVVEEGGLATFGSAWADIDNDGDLDLLITGYTNVLYYNNGDGTFTKYTTPELFNAPYPTLQKLYGPALEDVDGDGFMDFHNGGFSNPEILILFIEIPRLPRVQQNGLRSI
ncbi:hypothetical protein MASR2M41_07030 [Flammeovirgaceae bacterium]